MEKKSSHVRRDFSGTEREASFSSSLAEEMEEEEEDEYDGGDGGEREEEGTAGSEAWDEGDSRMEGEDEDEDEDEDEGGARGAEAGSSGVANKPDGAGGQGNSAEEEAPP